jgi:NodT family efflux transporter outer membrane factor (OMF) lipoprotein
MSVRWDCWSAVLLAGVVTSACAVGPEYRRPPVVTPAAFKEQTLPDGSIDPQWKPAEPRDDELKGRWWEAFGDPQLNALEEQVTVSNQNVAQAEAEFRAARAAIGGARAALFPAVTVGASASASRASFNRTPLANGVNRGVVADYQLPVDFSYEADVWGSVRRNVEANRAIAQATAADLQSVTLSMRAELATDYFQLRGLDAQRELLDSTVAAYDKALQLTVARHDQGVASGSDVAQARTQLDTTRSQATDLGVARAQFEHAIAILVGKPPAMLTIAPIPSTGIPPAIPLALPSELLERRPDVAAAERRVAAANAQIGVAKAAYFPNVSLTGSSGLESAALATLLSGGSGLWSLGSAVVQTVFDGGRRRAASEQAVAGHDAAVAVYRQDVLTAFQDVEDNLAALRILAEEGTQHADAVASAEQSLSLAMTRYQAGVTTYLEVITAQSAALANQIAAVDILTRRMTASVQLIKALGGGWRGSDLPAVVNP